MTSTASRRGARIAGSALLAAAAITAITALAPSASAAPPRPSGAGPATFGIGPSDGTGIDRRAKLAFLASPGATLTDHVAVVNLATRPTTLNVYTADAASSADGSVGYEPRTARQTDAAAWIVPTLPRRGDTLTLPARGRAVLPLAVKVPADATPGDHVAGVIVSLTSKVKNDKGQLIDFEQRVALRTTVRVSGTLTPKLAVEDVHAEYSGVANPFSSGSATVTYTVHNTGNVALGAGQAVSVSGLLGDDDAPSIAPIPLLLPKASVRMSVTVPGVLPAVNLTAHVTLRPLTAKGDVDAGLPRELSATAGFLAIPWALVALVVVLAALAVALRVWRRRPSAVGPGRHHRRPTAALS